MPKFLVLYRAPVSARDQMAHATPEQAKAGMDAWMSWAKKNQDAVVDLGSPLSSAATVKSGAAPASDGTIAGFSIVQGTSADAVKKKFADHPHLKMPGGAAIEVLEYLPMPGA